MAAIPRFANEENSPKNGPHSLLETATNAAAISGTDVTAFAGFMTLLELGAIPQHPSHPALQEGEGWAHYLACFGKEAPAQSERSISLAQRFATLREAGVGQDHIQQRSPLIAAVQSRNLQAIPALIEACVNVNFADRSGNTALHHAAMDPHGQPALRAILEAAPDAKLNFLNNLNQTPLQIAVSLGHSQAVRTLLAKGADHLEEGHHAAVKHADLSAGLAQLFSPRPAEPLLSIAASRGYADIVADLLAAGADPAKPDPAGNTPLHNATANLQTSAMEALLEHGRNQNVSPDTPNARGETALLRLMKEMPSILENIRANERNPQNAEARLVSAIGLLASHGANLNAKTGVAPRMLVRMGHTAQIGRTPLHWAVIHQHAPSIELLVKLGADPEAKSMNNETPKSLATEHPALLELLQRTTKLKQD